MNPTDVKRFHNDLKAAVTARAPIEIDEKSGTLTLSKMSQLEALTLPGLSDAGASVDESDKTARDHRLNQAIESQSVLPSRYRAALHAFDQSGTMIPVLDGLSARRIAQDQVSRLMSRAFIYLIFLLAVAFAGLILFKAKVVPYIDDLRVDIAMTAGMTPPGRLNEAVWLWLLVATIGCGFVVLIVWMLIGGAASFANRFGGAQYVRNRISTSAIRTLQVLLGAGLPIDDAVSVSCDLTAADAKVRQDLHAAVQHNHGNRYLDSLADFRMISANQRLAYLKVAAPTALVCSVGGIVALVYCVVIFWPIIAIVFELTSYGIQ